MFGVIIGLFILTFIAVIILEASPVMVILMSALGFLSASIEMLIENIGFKLDNRCFRSGLFLALTPIFLIFPFELKSLWFIGTISGVAFYGNDLIDTVIDWKGCR